MIFRNNVYFTVDNIDNFYNLSKNILREQFFSTFHAQNIKEDDKFIRYKVGATIERNYFLNTYNFYIVYNKIDDYYVLLNRLKCTVLSIQDEEFDNSNIEKELINLLLVEMFGYIPRFFFDEEENKVYSKISKYFNNRVQRYMKKYKNQITEYAFSDQCGDHYNVLYKGEMIPEYVYENIVNYNVIKYIEKLSKKEFINNNKIYRFKNPIENIKFYNVFCKKKIPKSAIKIENIKYLN